MTKTTILRIITAFTGLMATVLTALFTNSMHTFLAVIIAGGVVITLVDDFICENIKKHNEIHR